MCLPGLFTTLLIDEAITFFNPTLQDALRSLPALVFFPLCFLIGAAEIFYGRLIWRVWKRKRAIEHEIKIVSGIQIVEPPSPDAVERFYGRDGPIDKFLDRVGRYFSWTQDIGDKWNRIMEVWSELPFIFPLRRFCPYRLRCRRGRAVDRRSVVSLDYTLSYTRCWLARGARRDEFSLDYRDAVVSNPAPADCAALRLAHS